MYVFIFLAHQSRRLIGELIVYPCSGVRPSFVVRRPQFQNRWADCSHITHTPSTGRGKEYLCFCFDRIRTLVAMVTYASHRLIMEKSEN